MELEDKQAICNALARALQKTRYCAGLSYLSYDEARESVTARFLDGSRIRVNVEADSGIAMIKDILRALE